MTATELLTEVLPERVKNGRLTITWNRGPIHRDSGVLVIEDGKKATTYAVVSLKTDWPGRAFHFEKIEGEGTDPAETAYDLFCTEDADQHPSRCDCRGFTRHGHCKHHDAAMALLGNYWI